MLVNTYTYTARSADNPDRVMTFTLHDHSLSVDLGVPLEHVERAVEARMAEGKGEYHVQSWLKPMTISTIERATRPFDVNDVDVDTGDGQLQVRAWLRAGGLRVAPITLINEPVDNPGAAQAFAIEVDKRQTVDAGLGKLLSLLDYWVTWFVAGLSMVLLLQIWRHRDKERDKSTEEIELDIEE
jgi:hypothetical protein